MFRHLKFLPAFCLLTSLSALSLSALRAAEPVDSLTLWYDRPARYWVEALPVGNGRLGAMTFGGLTEDTLQLNEDTFWSGSPYNNINPRAKERLAEIRAALDCGEWDKAQFLAMHNITANKDETGHGMRYESLGNLIFSFPESHAAATDYCRKLSLNEAEAVTAYTADGVSYRREVFASYADSFIVVRLSASRPGSLSFGLRFASPEKNIDASARVRKDKKNGSVLMTVTSRPREAEMENVPNRLTAKTLIRVVPDGGTLSVADDGLRVEGSSEVLLFIAARTNFVRYDDIGGNAERRALKDLEGMSADFALLRMRHLKNYRSQFDRVKLSLGHNPVQEAKPTDVRIREFSTFYNEEGLPVGNGGDPGLVAMYFQFGRYLLMSSSQPGTQPANLQGIWNPDQGAYPAWDSKYTTNINVEMNYWPAEVTQLPECHEPFLRMVEDVSRTGRRSAREMYGARGWTLHHNTDLWRSTGSVDYASCSVWPTCNAWFCSHLMEHWLFTGDREFLARAYPVMKEASRFYQDFLIRDSRTGYLVASPSTSPENNPGLRDYSYHDSIFNKQQNAAVFQGVAMDNQMIYDLLKNTAEVARILGRDGDFADSLDVLKAQLPPMMTGRYGQLQEWLEDWDAEYTGHRHVSHLWGAFPGRQMSLSRHPEIAAAVKKSLLGRGDASRGWSMGWKVCLWARLLEGNHAFLLIRNQLKLKAPTVTIKDPDGGTYANGFDAHPPFQIDGNFGCTAGIAELLVQSHDGCVDLLPALPDALPSGRVSGLLTRGGFEIVDMTWSDGALRKVSIRSRLGGTLRLRSQTALRRNGVLLKTVDAASPCDNPLLQPYEILTPVVRDSSRLLPMPDRRNARVYDIATRAGEIITLEGVTSLSVAGRYLLENGKPFFWQGNTAWLIQRLDSMECETYCAKLQEEGYNVIQIQVLNGISPDFRTHDWNHLDQIVRIAARHHIYAALVPIWGGLVKAGRLSVDDAQEYGEMLSRRYGSQWNIVWMVGGDVPGSVSPEVWTALAEALDANDDLHLITYHPRGRTLSATWWNDAPWLDFHAFQSGHRRYGQSRDGKVSDGEFLSPDEYEDNWHYVEKSYALNDKPVVDAEPSYEHIPQGLHDPKEPLWEAPEVRRYAWWSVLSGAFGHTYGHNAQMSFHDPTRSSGEGPYGCRQSWQSSLSDGGFLQMHWLRDLFLDLVNMGNLASVRPDQSLITDAGDHHRYIPVLRASNFLVAYNWTSRPFTLDLRRLALRQGTALSAYWYSPSTGETVSVPDVKAETTEFRPLQPEAEGNDCVLVIRW